MKKILILAIMLLAVVGVGAEETKVKNVLIVYGSFAGSTKAAAESIGAVLTTAGCRVDITPASDQKMDLAKYALVVLGSAIHGATPHPDMLAFVAKNREALKAKITAVFIMCITITSSKPELRNKAEHYPEKVAMGFTPASSVVFAGVAQDGGWFGNWLGKVMLGIKVGDFRDQAKISAWARTLPDFIK